MRSGAARPEQARERDAERGEDREHRRQADDRERQQPAEGLRVDQKGVADPIKAGEEIAEAEPPAASRPRRARRPNGRPPAPSISQTSDRKGQEQHRPGVERRQRQRRERAGGEARSAAAASPRPDTMRVDRAPSASRRRGEF